MMRSVFGRGFDGEDFETFSFLKSRFRKVSRSEVNFLMADSKAASLIAGEGDTAEDSVGVCAGLMVALLRLLLSLTMPFID